MKVFREWNVEVENSKRLFQRKMRLPLFWHYGIKLSDGTVMGWEGAGPTFESTDAYPYEPTPAEEKPQYEILKRVLISCFAHDDFDYNWGGWNCEHWARGMACGNFNAFQTVIGAGLKNKEAENRMSNYYSEVEVLLKKHYPETLTP